jgi:hypothetical protein
MKEHHMIRKQEIELMREIANAHKSDKIETDESLSRITGFLESNFRKYNDTFIGEKI